MIFNTIFNHIYVLNLKESIDRKEHIQNEFKRVGITKYDFFEATPYYSDEVKDLMNSRLVKKFPNCFRCNKKRCNCENNYLTPYQIANWCSFINMFKDIIKNDYKFVLICEDDIVFTSQHKRIINKLLSPQAFKFYNININKPLLIRLGTAFNPDNHNSRNEAIFLKNYSLCNPCFAINKQMAIIYLYYLKIIDYHSDVYFHQKIPKNIKGIQFFTMYPYPVYELSFVKEKQKFESLIRPKNAFRRIEYKEFLFISSNLFLEQVLKKITKELNLNIEINSMGFNGNINYFLLLDETVKKSYFFESKILLLDDFYSDIKIIYNTINQKNILIYNLYLKKIKELFDIDISLNNDEFLLKNIIIFYNYFLKLLDLENIIKININNIDNIKNIYFVNSLKKEIINYNKFKNILLDKNKLTNEEIDLCNNLN
jgi:GR25 family glycosyltransferase involved in LPS biosynthesis